MMANDHTSIVSILQHLYTFTASLWDVFTSCKPPPQHGAPLPVAMATGSGGEEDIPSSVRNFLNTTFVCSNDPEAIQALRGDHSALGVVSGGGGPATPRKSLVEVVMEVATVGQVQST